MVTDGEEEDNEEEEDDIGDLESFMDDDETPVSKVKLAAGSGRSFVVDVALSMVPVQLDFYVGLVFPVGEEIVHLDVEIGKNGEIRVEGKGAGEFNVQAFEKALRACEDIPLALEWASRSRA